MRLFDMDSKENYLLDGKYKVCTPYAPLVDVVEVVRCKDCRWCQDDYMGTWCGRFSGVRFTNADDFCSHGERREDGEEE